MQIQATEPKMTAMNPYPAMTNALQGAVLLDEQGREIPITEEMIAQACDQLMKQCHFPAKAA